MKRILRFLGFQILDFMDVKGVIAWLVSRVPSKLILIRQSINLVSSSNYSAWKYTSKVISIKNVVKRLKYVKYKS